MNLFQKSVFVVSLLFIAVSCGKPSDTVEVSDAAEVVEATGASLAIDPASSTVNWRGYKPTGQHFGHIPVTSGEVMVQGTELTGAKFVFDIPGLKIEDIEESNENYGKLYGHLQSPDFFDAANHPQATFELTSVEPYSAGSITDKDEFTSENTPKKDSEIAAVNPTHWISGNLTLRGTTKNIKFPATVSIDNGAVTAAAGFNIDRTAWGLAYGDESTAADKVKDQFIYNTVSIGFEIKAD